MQMNARSTNPIREKISVAIFLQAFLIFRERKRKKRRWTERTKRCKQLWFRCLYWFTFANSIASTERSRRAQFIATETATSDVGIRQFAIVRKFQIVADRLITNSLKDKRRSVAARERRKAAYYSIAPSLRHCNTMYRKRARLNCLEGLECFSLQESWSHVPMNSLDRVCSRRLGWFECNIDHCTACHRSSNWHWPFGHNEDCENYIGNNVQPPPPKLNKGEQSTCLSDWSVLTVSDEEDRKKQRDLEKLPCADDARHR